MGLIELNLNTLHGTRRGGRGWWQGVNSADSTGGWSRAGAYQNHMHEQGFSVPAGALLTATGAAHAVVGFVARVYSGVSAAARPEGVAAIGGRHHWHWHLWLWGSGAGANIALVVSAAHAVLGLVAGIHASVSAAAVPEGVTAVGRGCRSELAPFPPFA